MTRREFSVSLAAMTRLPLWLTALVLSLAHAADGAEMKQLVGGLVRTLSPEFRRIELRVAEIQTELKKLPAPRKTTWGSRYGHRSGDLATETTPDWVQLDLGSTRRIDMVALVPVWLSFQGPLGAGYGFPKRFRIELADNPGMRDAVILVDHSESDVVNPGRNPMVMEVAPTEGRYLRLTSLKHTKEDGKYFWALEELIALEGNSNVARSVPMTQSSYMDLFPLWATVRLVDGQHALGMPVDVTRPSPNKGYLSAIIPYSVELSGELPADVAPWCMVDLGKAEEVEQIRVLPLESDDYEVYGGRGYPRVFGLQLALDPRFEQVVWEGGRGTYPLGYPAGCAITFQIPRIEARYVRIVASRLWSRDDIQCFGLAELQVYGGGQNLALGKPVSVKDQVEMGEDAGWAPAHLVDGFTSRFRLIEWPQFLQMMARRGVLEREREALEERLAGKLMLGSRLVFAGGTTLLVALLAGCIWILVWQRNERRLAMLQLRRQISRDLHDDIGSNLGGIALLSEIGSKHCRDEDSRQDFQTIHEAAEQASLSMRDIVWLVQRDEVGLKDMVMRMREAAEMILRRVQHDFVVDPALFKDRKLSLFFRRHLFFAYKEVLNNIRKHSRAGRVEIQISIGAGMLRFRVRDDGAGFDPAQCIVEGHGLGNLQRRARRLEGRVEIRSKPGSGCEVIFEANHQKQAPRP